MRFGWSETAVRVAFLGWFVDAACPASKQQWPKRYRTRNDEHAESPRTMRRVGINLLRANQRERDGENQPASQVSSQCNKEHGGNHNRKWVGTARCAVRAAFSGATETIV